jgi:hypothetical protein
MTDTAKTLTALPIVAVLLLAAFTVPSLGLVGVAEAKKQKVDPEGDTAPEEMFEDLSDLDIKSYDFKGKNAYIEVYGTAGGTIAEHEDEGFGHAIAYVLTIVTRSGEEQTWAIDSHEAQHGGSTDPSTTWHAHKVVLGDSPRTPDVVEGSDCLNEVDHVTTAMVDGDRMIFEDMKVKTKKGVEGVEAKRLLSAATVLLEVQVEDPDNPGDAPCVAKVVHVFDTAELGTVKKNKD